MDVLIALGGNAILQKNEKGTYGEQRRNIRETARHIARIIRKGHRVVITHGNGPQVGDILLRNEMAKDKIPPMPLHVCGGESQGMIGFMLVQELSNVLADIGIRKDAVCILTRTLVNPKDPHFKNPSKQIGPFYEKSEATVIARKNNWTMVKEDGKYRRIVPSPIPIDILEFESIRGLRDKGKIVICTGGGGVPVIKKGKRYTGVDAVIDKDIASSMLAKKLKVDMLLILTNVEGVFADYGKKNQRILKNISVKECGKYLEGGQFERGTMEPKVRAAMEFVKTTGKTAVITSLENVDLAINGKAGTVISK